MRFTGIPLVSCAAGRAHRESCAVSGGTRSPPGCRALQGRRSIPSRRLSPARPARDRWNAGDRRRVDSVCQRQASRFPQLAVSRHRDHRKAGFIPFPRDNESGDVRPRTQGRSSRSRVPVCVEQGLQPGKPVFGNMLIYVMHARSMIVRPSSTMRFSC